MLASFITALIGLGIVIAVIILVPVLFHQLKDFWEFDSRGGRIAVSLVIFTTAVMLISTLIYVICQLTIIMLNMF